MIGAQFSERIPQLTYHRASKQGVVRLNGKDRYCGAWGSGSKPLIETPQKYDRLLAKWLAAGRQIPRSAKQISIAEVLLAYIEHAKKTYRGPDGKPGPEFDRLRRELKPLRKLYARELAIKFKGLELTALRNWILKNRDWNRNTVNHAIGTIRRCFRWAASVNLVPASIAGVLDLVPDLKPGRSAARESK